MPARYQAARGELFLVRKSLYGTIHSVEGGKKIEAAMGVPLTAVLSWFGSSFPKGNAVKGSTWNASEQWMFGPEFLGIPFKARIPVNVYTSYTFAGWENGRPWFDLQQTFQSPKTTGSGSGKVIYNPDNGKIYLSTRKAEFRVGKLEIQVRAAAAHSPDVVRKYQ